MPSKLVRSLLLFCTVALASSGAVNPDLLNHRWTAYWISHPAASRLDYGVFHFRKHLTLTEQPAKFLVHVSADNRYQLFVNGQRVSDGPARGDLAHWRYESVDIAPQLHAGENVLAAVVWNYGTLLPAYQFSHQTAFLLQGDGAAEAAVNTGDSWKVLSDAAYQPLISAGSFIQPFEKLDAGAYPWGWQEPKYDDHAWSAAKPITRAQPRGTGSGAFWHLVPRTIPPMEARLQRLRSVRRAEGVKPAAGFLAGAAPIEIPAHSRAVLLLDQGYETTAYPELDLSGGQGAHVTLTYAEALVDSRGQKANRDLIEGMHITGMQDVYLADGGAHRTYRPLWFRAFRYIELQVETAATPITLHDFRGQFSAYPLEEKARFESSDPTLNKIWETGWRTARLCAGETYYDCPYYEQLQYVGDTRIQSLISLYVAGDDRLVRNAIQQFDDSRLPGGLTQSRYPSSQMQIIPPFSLFWVDMVHDYWMHRDDPAFVRSFLGGVRGVLDYHLQRAARSGMLGAVPWWNFVDWPDQWPWDVKLDTGGVPLGADDGDSAILTLQLVYALDRAAELMDAFDQPAEAVRYRQSASQLKQATLRLCWDASRGLLADSPRKDAFSQHANVLAVLTGLFPQPLGQRVMDKVMTDASLTQCTVYYRFYLYRAMKRAGLGDRYVEMLTPWRQMLSMGLTTFSERPEPTRSDCHAWSASPNYDLLASVVGIGPAKPGFRAVHVAPNFGPLTWVKGSMPHPKGEIKVELTRSGETGLKGAITLPDGVPGELLWKGKKVALHPGSQTVAVE